MCKPIIGRAASAVRIPAQADALQTSRLFPKPFHPRFVPKLLKSVQSQAKPPIISICTRSHSQCRVLQTRVSLCRVFPINGCAVLLTKDAMLRVVYTYLWIVYTDCRSHCEKLNRFYCARKPTGVRTVSETAPRDARRITWEARVCASKTPPAGCWLARGCS